jgi:1-acyl-sn-glycerol-3-phosphate acyltransferase
MKLGKVEKISIRYTLLKMYGKLVHDLFFYKKVTYIGTENIPKDKPVLIAPNHQNALMDALAIIYAQKGKQPVFLARSDIFKNSFIAKMLFFLKILPVFRLRDGKEKLKLNEVIYSKTIEVLENKRQVVIFPEATHIDKRHVRELKKGIQRIAFMLEEKHHFKAGVQIIPCGIYYSNYWNFRSKLLVNFGKPINLENYFEDYKNDPAKTIVKFTDELHEKIKELVIHIQDLNFHDEYDLITSIYGKIYAKETGMNYKRGGKIDVDKKIVEKLDGIKANQPDLFEKIMSRVKTYGQRLKDLRIKDHIVENSKKNNHILLRSLYMIIMLPIFIYGYINNFIVYRLPGIIIKKLKDRQFESSIKYGFSVFLFPIIYVLQSLIIYFIFKDWLITLAYFISLPTFGLAAFNLHRMYVKTFARFRFKYKIDKLVAETLFKEREGIIDMVKSSNA